MLTISLDPSLAAIAGDTAKVFDEGITLIRFGRAMDCDVRFSPGDDRLGRNHFELRRAAGGYELITDRQHAVFIGTKRVVGELAITNETELRLIDAHGPKIKLSFVEDAKGLMTDPHFKSDSGTVQGSLSMVKKAVAALGVVAVLGGGVMGYQWHRQNQIEQSFLDETAALKQKMASAPVVANWAPIFKSVSPSVYQVALMSNDKTAPQVQGTAFVVGPHRLITNAHVAALLAERANNKTLVLISKDPAQAPIEVIDAKIHPAYLAFHDVIAETSRLTGKEIAQQNGYDVAELIVEATLGPALPIASPEHLAAMKVGDAMAYVGYPANFAIDKSAQQLRIGYVSGTTDFLGTANARNGELIYHTAPAEGGTSGSPVFNDQGEVIAVHSGGERRGIGDDQVVTGSGTFYAQSAALIGDIEAGWSEAKMNTAKSEWQNAATYLAKRNELWALLAVYKDETSLDRLDLPPSFASKAKLQVGATRSTEGEAVVNWPAPSPGTYMAFVTPQKSGKFSLRVKSGDVVLQSPVFIDAAPTAIFKIENQSEVSFAISGKPDQEYWLQVIKLQGLDKPK
jgi:S1-C subfamily serine protease